MRAVLEGDLGGDRGMTGLRREGAHLEEQPGKGSGRSLDRAEELGAGVPAPVN